MQPIVNILIVTDGSGGFLTGDFHLGEFCKVLQDTRWQGFSVKLTKAHRAGVDPAAVGADVSNFDFSAHDLSAFDEILLFPIQRDGDTLAGTASRSVNATDAEVAAIARFMDAGGGVFATGDHENLGAGLCARLPRIRSMRRWNWPKPGPDGDPVAPPGTPGLATEAQLRDRLDTLRAGMDFDPAHPLEHFQFDDQSDAIAQQIQPRMFEVRTTRYLRQRWPHPLLCSPQGIVRHLPDHAHEGLCEVPSNLTRKITVTGYSEDEYPTVGLSRLAPVVVADATVIDGHATLAPDKPPVHGRQFGVIGAFDGHRARRGAHRMGRVVVDATWHHFFNINLVGSPSSSDPVKQLGFRAPLAPGQADHYRMIKHYFRNIVYWLMPAKRRLGLLHASLAEMVGTGSFLELNPLPPKVDLARLELPTLSGLASLAEAYFRAAHGACWTLEILPVVLAEFVPFQRFWERAAPWADPWTPQDTLPGNPPIDPTLLVRTALGAAVASAIQAHQDIGTPVGTGATPEALAKSQDRFTKLLPEALGKAMQLLLQQIRADERAMSALAADLEKLMTTKV